MLMFVKKQNHPDLKKTRFLLAGFHCSYDSIEKVSMGTSHFFSGIVYFVFCLSSSILRQLR